MRTVAATPERLRPGALLLPVLVAFGIAGILLTAAIPRAEAMGNAPSTCNNRYDGTITSFLVAYPGGAVNPMATPNATFDLYGNSTYSVAFTIHTDAQSSNNNTLAGSTWYDENLYGDFFGNCYPGQGASGIGPDEDVNITIGGITNPCCEGYMTYKIDFSTFLGSSVSFYVDWEPATTTSSSTATTAYSAPTSFPASSTSSTFAASTTSTRPASNSTSASSSQGENYTTSSTTSALTNSTTSSSSPSASSTPETVVSQASTLATKVLSSGPSAPALDITATGLGVAAAYAVGWAMIRRLR
jgi:hypothetical protein